MQYRERAGHILYYAKLQNNHIEVEAFNTWIPPELRQKSYLYIQYIDPFDEFGL